MEVVASKPARRTAKAARGIMGLPDLFRDKSQRPIAVPILSNIHQASAAAQLRDFLAIC
jgi:hypothetical protein